MLSTSLAISFNIMEVNETLANAGAQQKCLAHSAQCSTVSQCLLQLELSVLQCGSSRIVLSPLKRNGRQPNEMQSH